MSKREERGLWASMKPLALVLLFAGWVVAWMLVRVVNGGGGIVRGAGGWAFAAWFLSFATVFLLARASGPFQRAVFRADADPKRFRAELLAFAVLFMLLAAGGVASAFRY